MPTALLLRHGRSTANASGVLAGRAEGVDLDEVGREQARACGTRLAGVELVRVVCSPVARCRQTADLALAAAGVRAEVVVDERLSECDYGAWTGRRLDELAREGIWRTVQETPSQVTFPDGETMLAMRDRVVAAVADHDRQVQAAYGQHAAFLVVSHGDPIKAVVAHALGLPFDLFQRVVVDPGSVSVVHAGGERSFLCALNTLAGPVAAHVPTAPLTDATVGGTTGTDPIPVPEEEPR